MKCKTVQYSKLCLSVCMILPPAICCVMSTPSLLTTLRPACTLILCLFPIQEGWSDPTDKRNALGELISPGIQDYGQRCEQIPTHTGISRRFRGVKKGFLIAFLSVGSGSMQVQNGSHSPSPCGRRVGWKRHQAVGTVCADRQSSEK